MSVSCNFCRTRLELCGYVAIFGRDGPAICDRCVTDLDRIFKARRIADREHDFATRPQIPSTEMAQRAAAETFRYVDRDKPGSEIKDQGDLAQWYIRLWMRWPHLAPPECRKEFGG